MNTTTIIITILYILTAVYLLYMAVLNIFVFVANSNLGHTESFKVPLLYLSGGLILSTLGYIGFKMYKSEGVHLILKIIFYLPIGAVVLYILWAILLLLSSGGKWN